jgi:hypothetical protein
MNGTMKYPIFLILFVASCNKTPAPSEPKKTSIDDLKYLAAAIEITYCKCFDLENSRHSDKLNIILARSENEYNSILMKRYGDNSPTNSAGIYDARDQTIIVSSTWGEDQLKIPTTHEAVHHLNKSYLGEIDAWLNEGLATFFQYFASYGDFASQSSEEINQHIKDLFRKDKFLRDVPPVEEILMIKHHFDFEYNSNKYSIRNYNSTFAVICYLFVKHGPDMYNRIINYINYRKDSGKHYSGSKQAFKKAFDISLYKLNEEIKKSYLSSD